MSPWSYIFDPPPPPQPNILERSISIWGCPPFSPLKPQRDLINRNLFHWNSFFNSIRTFIVQLSIWIVVLVVKILVSSVRPKPVSYPSSRFPQMGLSPAWSMHKRYPENLYIMEKHSTKDLLTFIWLATNSLRGILMIILETAGHQEIR